MPKRHIVKRGDCIASIAFANGFFPTTIWEHEDNAELASNRDSPYVLHPGDVVVVPDRRDKRVELAMEQRHVFRRKGVPERLELLLLSCGQPRKEVAFTLEVGGLTIEGATSDEGKIEKYIPPDARQARVELETGEVYVVALGHLDPPSEPSGARARLRNLGLLESGGDPDDALLDALLRFQTLYELDHSGALDDATIAALREAHGS